MYRHLDSLLAKVKKKIRIEFNRLGMMGFDELNVANTKRVTKAMFDRLLDENEKMYLSVAKKSYSSAKKSAESVGYEGESDDIDLDWLLGVLLAYNLVTGYLYNQEAERKRLRLNEQILTAREHDSRDFYNTSLRRSANLWWTQTQQYGIDVVDKATMKAYKDSGVTHVRWVAKMDGRECEVCRERHNEVYALKEVPAKTHYNCRCKLEPVKSEDK